MVNKNILKIRKQLDKLDESFLNLIKKRTSLVALVLKNKRYKKDIIDKKRISIILKNISSNIRCLFIYIHASNKFGIKHSLEFLLIVVMRVVFALNLVFN